jgi:hypothetical protein
MLWRLLGFDPNPLKEDSMNDTLFVGLMLVASFGSLWGMFYARRAYQNTKKIMEKMGH